MLNFKKYMFVIALLCSIIIINLITYLIYEYEGYYAENFSQKRGQQIIKSLSEINFSDKKIMLVFGASDIESGFYPIEFDKNILKKIPNFESYNLGLRSIEPASLNILAQRIAKTPQINKNKAYISVIALTPALITDKSETFGYSKKTYFNFKSYMSDYKELILKIIKNPNENISLFFNKVFFLNRNPGIIGTWIYNNFFYSNLKYKNLPTYKNPWFQKRYQEHTEWNLKTRGFYYFNKNIEYDFNNIKLNSVALREMANDFQTCCDILNIKQNEYQVNEFIKTIKNVKKFSEHVILLVLPEAESVRAYSNSSKNTNLLNLVNRITAETEIKTIDLRQQAADFNNDAYWDIFHFTPLGRKHLNSKLSEEIINYLQL